MNLCGVPFLYLVEVVVLLVGHILDLHMEVIPLLREHALLGIALETEMLVIDQILDLQ